MDYSTCYDSPLGLLTLASDGEHLIGLWMEGQKYFGGKYFRDFGKNGEMAKNREIVKNKEIRTGDLPVFAEAKHWLKRYFAGEKPECTELSLSPAGTEFQEEVWKLLCEIPYGEVVTYGELAKRVAEKRGLPRMSAQAVGGAVGHNPISIIIPCHRVIGSDGSLTGYAGGIEKKKWLLELEGAVVGRKA